MIHDDTLVERIVAEVLNRLGRSGTDRRSVPSNGQLVIDEPVITAERLEQSLDGSGRVTFGERSVVTPSARDYLKQHNVQWNRQPRDGQQAGTGACWTAFVVGSDELVQRVLSDVGLRSEKVESAAEAARRAVAAVEENSGEGAVVLARNAAEVACRSNRSRQVRAVVAGTVRDVDSSRKQMGANVVCLPLAGQTFFELRNLLRSVKRGGPPRVPDGWEELSTHADC